MSVDHSQRYRAFRSLLSVLGVLVGLAPAGCKSPDPSGDGSASPSPAKVFKWKMVTTWPKNFPVLGTAPERFAQNVERMSNGRLRIKVYGAGELVPAFEVFDAVSSGNAELGHGAAYYWKGKVPEAQWFATVPFGLDAREMNGWLHHGGGLELWREAYRDHGIIPFAGGNSGTQMGGWFNKEVNSLEDIKGLKMRIPGLGGDVLSKVGGAPVVLPGGEIFTSLQNGTIDATEWVGPYNDQAFGLHKAAKYYYYPGWHEPGTVLEMIVNQEAFESLPPDLQAIVEVGIRAANQDMLDEFTVRNTQALQELITEHKVEVRAFPPEVLAALREASEEILKTERDRSPLGRKIYDSFTKFRSEARVYYRVAEDAYDSARQ